MAQLATMPLEKLPLLSLDLETTGLNTARDRVIQIGMIDPNNPASASQIMVQPSIDIPQSSTAIHGISAEDVASADPFTVAFRACRDAMADKVVIGYNIGFDLAILSAETERHGVEWQWGSALCLRQLATIALGRDAMLMMGDLDALAAHYDIDITRRHSALGDAEICAQLYFAMLDDLKEKSITSFGEARRAVSQLDEERLATSRAGWIDVASQKQLGSTSGGHISSSPLSRIDPYPYRHRISEIMMTNPLILDEDCSLHEAAVELRERRTDCAFVGKDSTTITGIISERDIVRAMALPIDEVDRARHIKLHKIMSSPVISVQENDYLHVALGRIARHDIRHLGVTDDKGSLLGWLSTRELIRQRVSDAIIVGDEIEQATDGIQIGKAIASLPNLAASLLSENVVASDIARVISSQYRTALGRCAMLAETKIISQKGPVPRAYAVLMLGSGGRDESLLAADQDHAIIYDDKSEPIKSDEQDKIQAWFEALGQTISDMMNEAGIPYCKGGVMSSSPQWCKPLSLWRKTIGDWCRKAGPDDLLSVDIFFDFALIHGDTHLGVRLKQAIMGRAARQPQFLKLIARSVTNQMGGIGLFGKLKMVNGRFEIKKHMLLPLIEVMRVLAISHSLQHRNSYERAKALFEMRAVPAEIMQLAEDIQFCMRLVLRQQIYDISDGLPPVTDITLDQLSKSEQKLLKTISGRVQRLDQLLQDCLF